MTLIYAVIGNPIFHSKSPQIQNAAFRNMGIDAVYTRIAAETASEALEIAMELEISGLNVTAPFKEEILKLVKPDELASRIAAVNTVHLNEKEITGTNTDVDGVVGAVSNLDLKNKLVVILGAGGAAKAAAIAITWKGGKPIIVNRTLEKAVKASKSVGCGLAEISELKNILNESDLLISAVSSTDRIIDPSLLRKDLVVLDAVYGSETALSKDAKSAGCKIISGKEWLLYSGARSFELFTGKKAPEKVMRKALDIETKTKSNISLIGMMGSGKDTISSEVANSSNMKIINTDKEIELSNKATIEELFKKGEMYFRSLERKEISKIFDSNPENTVISCGGGSLLDTSNSEKLSKISNIIWLHASPKILADRIKGEVRPLLNKLETTEEMRSELEDILKKRKASYAKAADLVISTNNEPSKITKRILDEVRSNRS